MRASWNRCMIVMLCLSAGTASAQNIKGDITDVIVYRGQALVTRTLEVNQAGDVELVVEDLPERIIPDSLYAQGEGTARVLSVRYRQRVDREDNRTEVKDLEARIEGVDSQLYQLHRDLQLYTKMCVQHDKYWDLNLQASDISLDRSVLSAETMKDLAGYLEEKNVKYHTMAVENEQKTKELEKQKKELEEQLEKLRQGHQTVHRQALIYLRKNDAAPTAVELSYLVEDAGWTPQYNLWAMPSEAAVKLEYLAVVHQASGEDWSSAALALSTAQPAMVASPPSLEPMEVTLAAAVQRMIGASQPESSQALPQQAPGLDLFSYQQQTSAFEDLMRRRFDNAAKGIQAQKDLNTIAISNQMIELEADRRMLEQMKEKTAAVVRTEGVSVLYRLDGQLTLPSRSDQQIVTIASVELPAEFTLLASPLLTDYVYLWGRARNTSDTILLPGSASMYRNGEFVGRGQMDLVTIGQSFDSGFGIDSQVRVVREFKDKKIETLWGNRIDEQTYTITVHNYKNQPARLRLMERIPWTENPQIEILLAETSHPLSEDPEYVRDPKDKGVLRWDLELPADSSMTNATRVTYTYTMKYDADMSIRPVSPTP